MPAVFHFHGHEYGWYGWYGMDLVCANVYAYVYVRYMQIF